MSKSETFVSYLRHTSYIGLFLPNHINSIAGYLGIGGDQGKFFEFGLRHEQTIERIVMKSGKCNYVQGMGHLNGKSFDPVHFHLFGDKTFDVVRKLEFSSSHLDGNFPAADDAQIQSMAGIA